MALPMLLGSSDCGPSNPLQTLTKRFDQERGLQQDYFGISRAGPSRGEAFRTLATSPSVPNQEAAHFFATSSPSSAPQIPSFDLSQLHDALPAAQLPIYPPQASLVDWAADFTHSHQLHSAVVPSNGVKLQAQLQHGVLPAPPVSHQQQRIGLGPPDQARLQWNPVMTGLKINSMPMYAVPAQVPMRAQVKSEIDQISWDKEFRSQELQVSGSSQAVIVEPVEPQVWRPSDELARTAAMLLDQVKDEQNPKFKNSQFMDLMRQLRDGKVTVEGNRMVETEGTPIAQVDVKGKGRAVDVPASRVAPLFHASLESQQEFVSTKEDPNDAYFRQENEDYIRYWAEQNAQPALAPTSIPSEWDRLQMDWDQFEATATGIRKVDLYQFQANNPYLLGDSSRQSAIQSSVRQSSTESVMELEAVVQRDMGNAMAWYHLGIKQQENERENKALQALKRAVELDPGHLPSLLALAISHANDGNRTGTFDAILEWVDRNEKYKAASLPARARISGDADVPLAQRYEDLINCLITMARSNTDGEIDADIQIALGVLLNADDEYGKAQDCFRTALALRPDDWLLHNRVGATMANSGYAEAALEYYYNALELNPGYIRARYNLGISCINIGRFEDAAQHILDALVLQESDGASGVNRGVTSSALWDSLKSTCLHMRRVDLATLCDKRDLDGFRSVFQIA